MEHQRSGLLVRPAGGMGCESRQRCRMSAVTWCTDVSRGGRPGMYV